MAEATPFDRLLSEQGTRVHRLCYALLGDRALAEEAAQEVFLRVWRGLGDFRGEAKLTTWLYSIARHVCLNIRQRALPPPALPLSEPEVMAAVERELVVPMAPERARLGVLEHLRQLPPDHRAAVILFYLEERSYSDAAAALGVPMGTFKTWLHRGKEELAARCQRSAGLAALPGPVNAEAKR